MPRRARLALRLPAWLLAVLALSLSVGLRAGPGDTGFTAASPGPSAAAAVDAREGDPHQGEQRGELPVKKPRVGSLRVRSTRVAIWAPAQGFHLQSPAPVPVVRPRTRALAPGPSVSVRRTNPALRLHPGQAPPRVA